MMQQKKTGFSLAELLIGLVIAAIIATMGMSVAKRGIENSYDAYIYAGYKGIMDAISEANADGYNLDDSNIGTCEFTKDILNMLNVKANQITSQTSSNIQFTTPNNITYDIRTSGTTGNAATGDLKHYYVITIWFPTPNLNSGDKRRNAEFIYAPDNDYSVLLPIPKDQPEITSEEYKNSLWNLAKRKDLLMFYIDDGKVGRVGADGKYKKREYYSLNDTICKTGKIIAVTNNPLGTNQSENSGITRTLFEIDPNNPNETYISHKRINECGNGNTGLENNVGVIRLMNPRKG